MRVFIIDQVDFVALGSSQSVFGACIPEVSIQSCSNSWCADSYVQLELSVTSRRPVWSRSCDLLSIDRLRHWTESTSGANRVSIDIDNYVRNPTKTDTCDYSITEPSRLLLEQLVEVALVASVEAGWLQSCSIEERKRRRRKTLW